MKFFLALTALVGTVASKRFGSKTISLNDVKLNSKLGNSIMSKARKLEQDEDEEADYSWVADFSIKFQGCHHVSQWNDEADGEEDVKIETKRLVRFRLCPTDSCDLSNAGGCSSGYGDYIIDMYQYLEMYLETVQELNEYECEYLEANVCQCNDDDQQDDGFDEDKCLYDCYKANGVEDICAEENPYEDDEQEQEEKFELNEYIECAQWEVPEDDNNRRRRLEEDEEEVEYFLGPYCASNGGAIHLGLFFDDTCTNFADDDAGGDDTYYSLSGEHIPYGSYDKSIIGRDCISCMEPEEVDEDGDNNDNDDGEQEAAEPIEFCEQLYQQSGKCETYLGNDNANENACTYMEGIKIIRKNGVVNSVVGGANKTATIFIGIFVVSFILLFAYVYYLRTKLDRASINLSE
mmetsp:Transcript_5564/g.6463  ORF Transcript_5564/g.6463 Transcript_5564/m.6463 type:complete len:406 (+) Transcript_5564:132-1349(+)|eukprot:CAMPEP_0194145162 /NCGR_PEP_ID=MMETSP0152-20130528/15534_1 /TAXON_ID=1049557 /ORGANISM="Thalassiothrix antarctica, Strain L6-D1" /LENGTH=405 /DNA_ID=CAMNT_0038845271 /DNA_START=91 /DNA_END=1308 /DNA_ORIENTATION=+